MLEPSQSAPISLSLENLPRFAIVNTFRGLEARPKEQFGNPYTRLLGYRNTDHLLRSLVGLDVLDLGSGHGIFARDVIRAGTYCRVHSLNPAYILPSMIKEMARVSAELYPLSQEQLADIERRFLRYAIAGTFEEIPAPNGLFGKVYSVFSFPSYCESKAEFKRGVQEVSRVSSDTSEIRIYPVAVAQREIVHREFAAWDFKAQQSPRRNLEIFVRA